RLSESQATKIHKLKLDGLELEQQYSRFYPQEEMAADVIGYVDGDHRGQAGIELSQKQLLERNALNFSIRRAGNGMIQPSSISQDLLQSNDWQLQLTLDMRLQRAAREALRSQMKAWKAKRGTVLIMDSKDGAILAMVNEPTFNPNEYYKSKVEYFKNWSVSDLYEPGSTFKQINVALALNDKAITNKTVVYDGGSVRVGSWTIKNSHAGGGGAVDVPYIIKTSSNVGMVGLMRHLKPDRYYTLLQELGMTSKTGIDLPGEVANYLKPREQFVKEPIEVATAAFGQGISITPIKLLQLNAALANGGRLVTPHVVEGLADARGTLHWRPDYPVKTVFAPQHAYDLVKMMGDVVNADGGTGKSARIKGYEIGGKTGTAQKAGPRGGYLANSYITSFVSILPVDNPRYVVLAVVDEPKGGNTYGGTVAAPIVKKVMEALIAIKGIPPTSATEVDPMGSLAIADDPPKKK
ncbi:MAG: peptidoglycan D,D-transpeptidase FtsI family protein, partial [Microcystaceae cyanobacterium]